MLLTAPMARASFAVVIRGFPVSTGAAIDKPPAREVRQGGSMRTVLVIVALVALAGGPAWAGSAREAIDAANQKFEAVFNKGDAAGVAQLYAEEAVLLPPGELRVDGMRPAIEAHWKGTIDAGI